MLLENDEGVRCCPISHAEQEGIEDFGKMLTTGYSDDDVDNDTDESPDESRDLDCPVSEDLSRETEGVVVGDIACNDGESNKDKAEFTESTGGFDAHSEEATNTRGRVGICPVGIIDSGGHCCGSEPFDQVERDEQTKVCPSEWSPGRVLLAHVDVVVHGK